MLLFNLQGWWLVAAMIIYLAILFYGSYAINSGFYLPVTCSAITKEKKIAISFDDGPDEKYTPEILRILQQQHVQAAFFCIGKKIAGRESMLLAISENGHLIGNHSFSHHFWFPMFTSEKMISEFIITDNIIKKITGHQPKFFRPPYGVTNPNIRKAVQNRGYKVIGWNVRSMDTVIKERKKLLNKLIDGIRPGAIFLFHDTPEITVAVLPQFLTEVKARGYDVERLDHLLNLKAYE